jgi:hypothetical protein
MTKKAILLIHLMLQYGTYDISSAKEPVVPVHHSFHMRPRVTATAIIAVVRVISNTIKAHTKFLLQVVQWRRYRYGTCRMRLQISSRFEEAYSLSLGHTVDTSTSYKARLSYTIHVIKLASRDSKSHQMQHPRK